MFSHPLIHALVAATNQRKPLVLSELLGGGLRKNAALRREQHDTWRIATGVRQGTVIGAGANIFGSSAPPKVVSPFAWGEREPYDTYDVAKFLTVAERVMARRHVELGEKACRTPRR